MFGHDDNTSEHDESTTNQPVQDDPTGAPTVDDSILTTPDNDSPAYTTTPPDNGSTSVTPVAHDDTKAPATVASNDLLEIKQSALQQLSPLVGHLNQTPEEKFRTTMMMIQASDDQSLIKQAYEAAQAIEDEKTRAQALLDIINEINYFTQHS